MTDETNPSSFSEFLDSALDGLFPSGEETTEPSAIAPDDNVTQPDVAASATPPAEAEVAPKGLTPKSAEQQDGENQLSAVQRIKEASEKEYATEAERTAAVNSVIEKMERETVVANARRTFSEVFNDSITMSDVIGSSEWDRFMDGSIFGVARRTAYTTAVLNGNNEAVREIFQGFVDEHPTYNMGRDSGANVAQTKPPAAHRSTVDPSVGRVPTGQPNRSIDTVQKRYESLVQRHLDGDRNVSLSHVGAAYKELLEMQNESV